MPQSLSRKTALSFVLLMSLVSLFADMTYEGARSVTGPWLALLGANAAKVGFIAGFAEFLGYALRLVSGKVTDSSKKYWTITFLGYACNLLAVPCLALTHHWFSAAFFIVLERSGKAIRVPPKDAMLSHAGEQLGMGWVFGLNEAIDQIGAMAGPLIISLVLYLQYGYRTGFALLLIPALLALCTLWFARQQFPSTEHFIIQKNNLDQKKLPRVFWIYLIGSSLIAAGFTDFPLMAFHFAKIKLISPIWIPIFYAIALGITSVTAPLLGYFYDRYGFLVLILISICVSFFSIFIFLGHVIAAFIGTLIWGIGISAHETLMRAIVAHMTQPKRRASAYGIFNFSYGLAWWLGSVLLGILYDISPPLLVSVSVSLQLIAIPFLWWVMKELKRSK